MNADAQTKIIFEMEIQDWHHLGINLFRRTEYTSQEIDSWAATESKPKLIEFVVAQQRQYITSELKTVGQKERELEPYTELAKCQTWASEGIAKILISFIRYSQKNATECHNTDPIQ